MSIPAGRNITSCAFRHFLKILTKSSCRITYTDIDDHGSPKFAFFYSIIYQLIIAIMILGEYMAGVSVFLYTVLNYSSSRLVANKGFSDVSYVI